MSCLNSLSMNHMEGNWKPANGQCIEPYHNPKMYPGIPSAPTDFTNNNNGNMNSKECSFYGNQMNNGHFGGYSQEHLQGPIGNHFDSQGGLELGSPGGCQFDLQNFAPSPPGAMYPCEPHHRMAVGYPEGACGFWPQDAFCMDTNSKRKRKRIITMDQRRAANIRERKRMFQLNDAFDKLRKRVPTFAYEKKLSRIETLRLAVTYIEFMSAVVKNNEDGDEKDGHSSDGCREEKRCGSLCSDSEDVLESLASDSMDEEVDDDCLSLASS